jgi:type VI protein secretion system component VasF
VCWLDELLGHHDLTAEEWQRQTLETLMYGTNDGDWRFWEQARIAETLPYSDALETHYLCVTLGFRGKYRDTPAGALTWAANAMRRIDELLPHWRAPAALKPVIHVPLLSGQRWLNTVLAAAGMLLCCLIPLVAFLLARDLAP